MMDEEYAQAGDGGMYLPSPSYNSMGMDAMLVEKIDPARILDNISHFLKGEIMNDEGVWVRKLKPLCNIKGMNRLMLCAGSIINNNTTFSELNDKEISDLVYFLSLRLIKLLALNCDEFEINRKDLDIIWENICDTALLALKRAKNRGEMKALKTTISTRENVMIQPKQQGYGEPRRRGIFPFKR